MVCRVSAFRVLTVLAAIVGALTLPATSSPAAVTCPAMDPSLTTDVVFGSSGMKEVSGIQSSLDHPGVLWVIQDSGNGSYLYAFDMAGGTLATFFLDDTKNVDWEAIGLDNRDGTDLLYIGDIGDNPANRDGAQRPTPALLVLPEPTISVGQSPPVSATLTDVTKYAFRYFDQADRSTLAPRDAESMFVDPRTHNVFVFLKDLRKVDGVPKISRVFELKDQDLHTSVVNHAVHVTDVIGAGAGVGTGPVSADVSRDGSWIVLKNYLEGFIWHRGRSQSVTRALAASLSAPCRVEVDGSESIAFGYRDGVWTQLLSLREDPVGSPPLHVLQRAWV